MYITIMYIGFCLSCLSLRFEVSISPGSCWSSGQLITVAPCPAWFAATASCCSCSGLGFSCPACSAERQSRPSAIDPLTGTQLVAVANRVRNVWKQHLCVCVARQKERNETYWKRLKFVLRWIRVCVCVHGCVWLCVCECERFRLCLWHPLVKLIFELIACSLRAEH